MRQGYASRTGLVVEDVLAHGRAGDVLFMPGLRLPHLSTQWAPVDDVDARLAGTSPTAVISATPYVEAKTRTLLAPISARGVRLLFEAPPPLFKSPAFRCADSINRRNAICKPGLTMPRDQLLRYRTPVLAAMRRVQTSFAESAIWDPLPVLCPQPTCRAIVDGRPLYFDGDHLAAGGNAALVPSFVDAMTALAAPR